MSKIFTTSLGAALAVASAYSFFTLNHISSISTRNITFTKTISDLFRKSKSVTNIVNPKKHIAHNSSRSISVMVPRDACDEVILAKFVQGFFGGYVLAPERSVLRLLRLNLVGYDHRLGEVNVAAPIWSATDLSSQTIPPLQSKLFGGFQVVDCQLEQHFSDGRKTHSYIDFAFGYDTAYLAGVHRFSVWRNVGDEKDRVLIEYEDTAFNPKVDKPLMPNLLLQFHLVYAMLLFREGVSNVIQS